MSLVITVRHPLPTYNMATKQALKYLPNEWKNKAYLILLRLSELKKVVKTGSKR